MSVTSIGAKAFYSYQTMTKITLPESLKSIGTYAFYLCKNLTSIDIPDSIEYAGRNVFNGTPWIENQSGLVYVGKVAYKYVGEMPENTSVTLRADTTCIAAETFKDCSLSEISMPDKVTIIDKGAFYKTNLTEIKLSTSLAKLGGNVFYGCASLESAFLPNGITELSTKMFSDCANLKSVNIPESVTAINGNAFNKCTSLENIELHDGITYIGAYAFRDCAFTRMTVPAGMTSLSANTFYECTNLKEVVIQDGLTTINTKAFNDCPELETIEIPDSVKTINTNAFYKCPNLTLICLSDSFEYTGKSIKPKVTVSNGSDVLTLNTDYVIRYSDNIEIGTASVIIAGRGKYTGRIIKTFTILDSNAKQISECTITLSKTTFAYTGNTCKPKVTVSDGDTVLTIGTDYNVRYVNNIEVGTAAVVISGTGKYQGLVEKSFIIE